MTPFETFHLSGSFKNVTRNILLWLTGITLLALTACQQDMELEKGLTFPAKFVYSGFELGPTSYYEVEADGFREISDKGRLAPFDSVLLEFLEEIPHLSLPFEMKLLSDSTVRFSFYEYPDKDSILTADISYRKEGDYLFIELQGENVWELIKNDVFDQLKLPSYSDAYTYYSDHLQRREISGVGVTSEIQVEYPEFILDLNRDKGLIETGDTIAVNRSFFVYELEAE